MMMNEATSKDKLPKLEEMTEDEMRLELYKSIESSDRVTLMAMLHSCRLFEHKNY